MDDNLQRSVVSLVWEIRDFSLYMKLHEGELESPPFSIKCYETISWFLTIRARDHFLDCFLYRLNRNDDLGDIYIKFRIFVIGEDGSMHFSRLSGMKMDKDVRSIEVLDFLNTTQLRNEHMANGTLRLQLNLGIAINENLLAGWSNNEDLERLSSDMLELYDTSNYSNKLLRVDDREFKVHSFVIGARCPGLSTFDPQGIPPPPPPSSPTRRIRKFPGIAFLFGQFKLPPKSNFIHRPARSRATHESSKLFQKTFDWRVCDVLLRYLYSGRISTGELHEARDDLRFRLLVAARHYNLWDLARRLDEVESKTTATTELVVNQVTLDFDLGFLTGQRDTFFYPITRLINISNTDRQYMSVTFSVVQGTVNRLHISCRLIESELPVTVKSEICVFDSKFMEAPLQTFKCITCVCFHESWSPPIEVWSNDNVRLKCIFSICNQNKVEISRQEFLISSMTAVEPNCLRQLSNDFATAMTRTTKVGNNLTDMMFEVRSKEFRVHRHIILSRMPRFRRTMSPRARQRTRRPPEIMVRLIEYAYTGILFEKDARIMQRLLEAARSLEMTRLESTCQALLARVQV